MQNIGSISGIFRLSAVLAVFFCESCSVDRSSDDTPFPISPRPPLEEALNRETNSQTSKKVILSPASTREVPKEFCDSSVTKTPQTAGENEKNGALVVLGGDENLQESILVYRIAGNSIQSGSFLMVPDLVFGPSGTHPSGNYVFEIQSPEGQSCMINVSISEDDAQKKEIISVSAKFP